MMFKLSVVLAALVSVDAIRCEKPGAEVASHEDDKPKKKRRGGICLTQDAAEQFRSNRLSESSFAETVAPKKARRGAFSEKSNPELMKALEELRNNEETGSSFAETATPVHNPQRRKAMGPVELGNLEFFQDKKKSRRGGMGPDELEQLEQIQAMLPSDRLSERRGAINAQTLSPDELEQLKQIQADTLPVDRLTERRAAITAKSLSPKNFDFLEQWNALVSHGSSSAVMGDSRKHQRRGAMDLQELDSLRKFHSKSHERRPAMGPQEWAALLQFQAQMDNDVKIPSQQDITAKL